MGAPHPGPQCAAFDIDLMEWRYAGEIWRPYAMWEETRLGGRHKPMKGNQLRAFEGLSAQLCVPVFLVEVNEGATVFLVHGVFEGGWTKQMDRDEMKRFVEALG